jgi:hypothetical protein
LENIMSLIPGLPDPMDLAGGGDSGEIGGNPLDILSGGGNPLDILSGGGNPLDKLSGGGNPLDTLGGGSLLEMIG